MTDPRPPAGPRPLPLHMAIQTSTWLSSLAALTISNGGLPTLRPELANRARDLEARLAGVDPEAFRRAVESEARRRLDQFTQGVRRYRHWPRPPRPPEPPEIWREGSSRLLDYGKDADAPVVLVIPSLVNRYWVLDLAEDQSLLRDMAGRGLRPLVVDWGAPQGEERAYDMTDYIAGRLERALAYCRDLYGRPVGLVGYCMGGLLALALAARRPDDVSGLALLAAPWDFHAAYGDLMKLLEILQPGLEATIATLGVLPVDMLQAMFTGLDPYMTPAKFRRFADLDPASEEARRFVALEDWLNDGVDLAGPVAIECFRDWHLSNTPARGQWRVGERPVLAGDVTCPALVVVPERDHIVPPASSQALAGALPSAETLTVAAGHIGLVAGSRAGNTVFAPLARWLANCSLGKLTPVK